MFTRWTDGNKEILFARPGGCNIWDYEKHATPRGSGGNGGLGVSQSLVDAFFMKNGLPIDDSASGYSDVGYSTASDRRNTEWIEGSPTETPGEITTAGTYNMYCNREARFYVTVLYNDAWFRESNRRTEFHNPDMDGGGYNSPQAGYLLRKKVHPDHNELNDNYIYRPGILYRLGEAYLNYAEALNECDPGNADILVYLNKIRERAGIPTYGVRSRPDCGRCFGPDRHAQTDPHGTPCRTLRRGRPLQRPAPLEGGRDSAQRAGLWHERQRHDPRRLFPPHAARLQARLPQGVLFHARTELGDGQESQPRAESLLVNPGITRNR